MAGPTVTVAPPQRKPRAGGIKSVVGEFQPAPRLGVASTMQWISDGCDFPKAAPGLCYAPTPVTGSKEFGGVDAGSGPIFALYSGVRCYLGPASDYEQRARALLVQGEGRGVEEVLWEYGMTAGGTGPAQTNWVSAIGQMDEAADTLYVGQPVIMLSRFAAVQARAAKALFGDEETGRLWTANGTPVIASAAAPDNVAIVMGWPSVYASEVIVNNVIDPVVNQEMALAERIYGIAVDCAFALHYAVTVAAGDPGGGPTGPALALTIGTEPASPIPDGTDTTITVHANVSPDPAEVHLFYRINGGGWTDAGEMTETGPLEYVENVDGTLTSAGDVVELYAKAGSTQSPTITVNVT